MLTKHPPLEPGPEGLASSSSSSSFVVVCRRVRRGRCADQTPSPFEPGPEGNYHLILKGNYHLTLKVDLTKGIIILLNLTLQRVISPYSESYLTYQAPLACPDSMVLYNGVPLACSSLRSNPSQVTGWGSGRRRGPRVQHRGLVWR